MAADDATKAARQAVTAAVASFLSGEAPDVRAFESYVARVLPTPDPAGTDLDEARRYIAALPAALSTMLTPWVQLSAVAIEFAAGKADVDPHVLLAKLTEQLWPSAQ